MSENKDWQDDSGRDGRDARDDREDRRGDDRRGDDRDAGRRSRSRSPARMQTDDDRGRGSDGQVNPGNNLHVSGLSRSVEERDLEDLFSQYGKVAKCNVMRDPHSRESRGFAFVTMETAEAADAALALSATELQGRTINVAKARRGRARTPTPGQYQGPAKRDERRGYDSRGGYGGRYDDRRYDDRRGGYGGGGGGGYDRGYDRGGYDRGYDRGYDSRGGYGAPPPPRDDRRYDRRPAYDDRRY